MDKVLMDILLEVDNAAITVSQREIALLREIKNLRDENQRISNELDDCALAISAILAETVLSSNHESLIRKIQAIARPFFDEEDASPVVNKPNIKSPA